MCSVVRILESDCLALLHTSTSLKHLAQCSQLQEVNNPFFLFQSQVCNFLLLSCLE